MTTDEPRDTPDEDASTSAPRAPRIVQARRNSQTATWHDVAPLKTDAEARDIPAMNARLGWGKYRIVTR